MGALCLSACAPPSTRQPTEAPVVTEPQRITEHRDDDDLLSAGLGLEGLRAATPPIFADAGHPTAAELRRRAIWTNWRGIADLAPGGGYGTVYGGVPTVPGREYHAFAALPGAREPHRVLAQVPDAFDAKARCIVVTASSGSRGIYGAIALAGAWGLPRGCAVAYTDKGAGTGWFDPAAGQGARLDGTPGSAQDALDFAPANAQSGSPRIAVKHAHSQDNPEADWGRHVRQAAEFALRALDRARPAEAPFTFADTRVIAVGVSNGGGAVLRAAEDDGGHAAGWLDGVVAISPNIQPGQGGRALFDYTIEAALFMPCALLAPTFDGVALARPGGAKPPAWAARCASLKSVGLLAASTPQAQAAEALERLRASGWALEAIAAGALSTGFDLWRAVAVTYASAYARAAYDAMPCGYAFAAMGADGAARAPTAAERAAWWADSAGIPPGAGVGIVDAMAAQPPDDPAFAGLHCLQALWSGDTPQSAQMRASVAATRASLPREDLSVVVVHGADDGQIPEAFSGGAYVDWANATTRDVRYWRVRNAQHFDAFLGLPPLAARYVPLMPYAYRALDALWAHLEGGAPLPATATIDARPRGQSADGVPPLTAANLAMPD